MTGPGPRALARWLASALLAWYDRHRRALPWRAAMGARPDPYHVWLSEVMLQQTTVATVVPYFHRCLARWPTLEALAAADLDAVLHAWQGLGYYARGRNLHACARTILTEHGGRLPTTAEALRTLPGIGDYTAAAIAAIAFGRRATAVDANIERVLARLHAVETPLPAAKRELRALAAALTPSRRPGDYTQALMDLGATICTPRRPACTLCPWREPCLGRAHGTQEALPRRAPRRERPLRHGISFWLADADGRVLLRRRPERGLLGGLMELPGTPWRDAAWTLREAAAHAPARAGWRLLPGTVHHGFTHFALDIRVAVGRVARPRRDPAEARWVAPDGFAAHALPTLTKKLARFVAAHCRGTG